MKTILFLLLFLPAVCFGEELKMNMLGCSYDYVLKTLKTHHIKYELDLNSNLKWVVTVSDDDGEYIYIFENNNCFQYKYLPYNTKHVFDYLEKNTYSTKNHWVTYGNPSSYWHIQIVNGQYGKIYIFVNSYDDLDMSENESL